MTYFNTTIHPEAVFENYVKKPYWSLPSENPYWTPFCWMPSCSGLDEESCWPPLLSWLQLCCKLLLPCWSATWSLLMLDWANESGGAATALNWFWSSIPCCCSSQIPGCLSKIGYTWPHEHWCWFFLAQNERGLSAGEGVHMTYESWSNGPGDLVTQMAHRLSVGKLCKRQD